MVFNQKGMSMKLHGLLQGCSMSFAGRGSVSLEEDQESHPAGSALHAAAHSAPSSAVASSLPGSAGSTGSAGSMGS